MFSNSDSTVRTLVPAFTFIVCMLLCPALLLGQQTYTAHLSGGSEVPSVTSTGSGTVTAVLTGDTLEVTGSFSGLVSDFNAEVSGGSHIHTGYAGQNGPIVFNLAPALDADQRGGVFEASDNRFGLDAEQMALLSQRRFYVNVHTDDFPGGELRGQLLPESDATYEITLSGGAAVPIATTTATGAIVAELSGDILRLSGSFQGLQGKATAGAAKGAIHIHRAYAGGVGGMVFQLNPIFESDFRSGVLTATGNVFRLTPGQMNNILNGRGFYVDLHTTTFPSGELRGQILPTSDLYFDGHFNGLNEVPPNTSGGTGGVAAELSGDQLIVTGTFSQMVSPFNPDIAGGAHLHAAGPDENGPISIPLNADLVDPITGHFFAASSNTFTVTAEQVEQLLAGDMYANVHTVASPGGELRAQLLRSPNNPPPATSILQPAPGPMTTGGPSDAPFSVSWTSVGDPEGDDVVYIWQFSRDEDFGRDMRLADVKTSSAAVSMTQADIDSLLAMANLPVGLTRPFYHRVIVSDGSGDAAGPAETLRITRGELQEAGSSELLNFTATEEEAETPTAFALKGAYPNPFNPSTNIVFDLERKAVVSIDVFDISGRPVLRAEGRPMGPGASRSITIDAESLPAGVYIYRVEAVFDAESAFDTGRMVLLK